MTFKLQEARPELFARWAHSINRLIPIDEKENIKSHRFTVNIVDCDCIPTTITGHLATATGVKTWKAWLIYVAADKVEHRMTRAAYELHQVGK